MIPGGRGRCHNQLEYDTPQPCVASKSSFSSVKDVSQDYVTVLQNSRVFVKRDAAGTCDMDIAFLHV